MWSRPGGLTCAWWAAVNIHIPRSAACMASAICASTPSRDSFRGLLFFCTLTSNNMGVKFVWQDCSDCLHIYPHPHCELLNNWTSLYARARGNIWGYIPHPPLLRAGRISTFRLCILIPSTSTILALQFIAVSCPAANTADLSISCAVISAFNQ